MSEDKYEQISGKKLADLRRARGYSQDAWAVLMDYTTGGLRRIEPLEFAQVYRGKFRKLAESLAISIDELRSKVGIQSRQAAAANKLKSMPGVHSGQDLQNQHESGLREAASHSKAAADMIERKKKNRGK